jgi:hypothetical protein
MMMNEKFYYHDGLCGFSRACWVEKLSQFISMAFVMVDSGKLGEIAAAMFCLFCADEIHKCLSGITYQSVKWIIDDLFSYPFES